MPIADLFKPGRPVLSFEVFPPKRDGDVESLYRAFGELAPLKPDYISVTYGAGGFAVGYQPGPPVTDACPGRFAVPDGLVLQVVIEAQGAPHRDPAAEARVAMAKQ